MTPSEVHERFARIRDKVMVLTDDEVRERWGAYRHEWTVGRSAGELEESGSSSQGEAENEPE